MHAHIFLLLLAAWLGCCHPPRATTLEWLVEPHHDVHDEMRAPDTDYLHQNAFETIKLKRSPLPFPEWELLTRRRYLRRNQPAASDGPSTAPTDVEYEFNLFREERPTQGLLYSERRAAASRAAAGQR